MSMKESRAHTARLSNVRIAPRKARVVVDLIRGKQVGEALDILRYSDKGFATTVYKLLDSAIANVSESELGWDLDRLYVSRVFVDEGATWRRFRARAQGRATRINKRTSHVSIELGEF